MVGNLAGAGFDVRVWNRNTWILSLVEGLGEAIALAEALEVDPARFLETIEGGPAVYASLAEQ